MVFIAEEVDYRELIVLNAILGSNNIPVTVANVYRYLRDKGYTYSRSNVSFIMNSRIIKRYGIGAQVNYYSLGLRKLIVVLEDVIDYYPRNYLALRASLMPYGMLLSYYLPFTARPDKILEAFSDSKIKYYFIISYEYAPRPNLLEYYYDYRLVIDLPQIIDSKLSRIMGEHDIVVDKRLKNFSLYDLFIIKELQKNAMQSLKNVSETIGVKYDKVFRRFRHILEQKIIDRLVLRRAWIYNAKYIVVVALKPREDTPLYMAARTLSEIPLIGNVGVNEVTGTTLVTIIARDEVSPQDTIDVLKKYYRLEGHYIVDNKRKKIYTIPYTSEYSKYKGTWLEFTTQPQYQ